jgi:cytochrome c oxidase assembly protein subunit 15
MVFLIVVIGGITRLTESGLSITEWRPVTGVVPPLSDAQWEEEFARYRQTTEFEEVNRGMSIAEFKVIWFWEYLHRLWGRLVGLAFVVPFALFLVRNRIPAKLRRPLWTILVLIAAQGVLGWYMVQSGLIGRTDVSQYRLVAHLSLALLIYCLLLWYGVGLLGSADAGVAPWFISARRSGARGKLIAVLLLVCATIVSGAFVAGLNAGKIYNTFPLMGGRIVPPGYGQLRPWWLNLFENPLAAQFNHRLLAVLTLVFVTYVVVALRRVELPSAARRGVVWMGLLVSVQVALGIATLLAQAPLDLAVAHQTTAVLVLTATVVTIRQT